MPESKVCQDPVTHLLANQWVTLHQDGVPAGFKRLLVVDVWEHASMRDYGATERAQSIEAFLQNIDWRVAERRRHEQRAVQPAAAA
jgi:Fe-Mn family superoxide dismutase